MLCHASHERVIHRFVRCDRSLVKVQFFHRSFFLRFSAAAIPRRIASAPGSFQGKSLQLLTLDAWLRAGGPLKPGFGLSGGWFTRHRLGPTNKLDCPHAMGTNAFSPQWAESFRHFLLLPSPSVVYHRRKRAAPPFVL